MTAKKATTKETTKKKITQKKSSASPSKACCRRPAEPMATSVTPNAATKKTATHLKEKRRHLRLHYSRLISFIQYDAKNQVGIPAGMAAIKNLSEAGILIEVGNALQPGDPVDLDIAFEEEKIIPARGEIIHTQKLNRTHFTAGVKFTKITKRDLMYLKNFIAKRTARK